jgi:transcriptional regulator with XRE-family HTH domain/tetratricopeptide (TPR) repeat protein
MQDPEPNYKLQAARDRKVWTLEEAAEAIGVGAQTFWRWENYVQWPRQYSMRKLIQVFGASAEELGFGKELAGAGDDQRVEETVSSETLPPTSSPVLVASLSTLTVARGPLLHSDRILAVESDLFTLGIMALVLHQQRCRWDASELSLRVRQALHEKMPEMRKGQPISRREALRFIAGVPLAVYGFADSSDQPTSALVPEEVIPLYAAGVPACWRLYYEGGQAEVEGVLPAYLTHLTTLSHAPSKYQRSAAALLSEAHQLSALLAQGREDFGKAIAHCKQAALYGQVAGDANLQAMSLIRQYDTFYENRRFSQWFLTLKEAESFAEKITPLLRGRIYARLAFAYARQAQSQVAWRYIGLAQDTFPDHPETDPGFLYSHSTHFILYANKALAYMELGQAKDAWEALKRADEHVPGPTNPRKIDVTLYQIQAAMGLKNLELSCDLFESLVSFITQFGNELDVGNAHDIYQQLSINWPYERRVRRLEEYLHPR